MLIIINNLNGYRTCASAHNFLPLANKCKCNYNSTFIPSLCHHAIPMFIPIPVISRFSHSFTFSKDHSHCISHSRVKGSYIPIPMKIPMVMGDTGRGVIMSTAH